MTKSLKFWTYVYIFFLFFGPKFGKYLDTSILASIWMILASAGKNDKKIVITKYTQGLLASLFLVILYSVVISWYNSYVDVTYYGRMVRSFLSILSVSMYIREHSECDADQINEVIIRVLLIHAAIVLVSSTVFVDLQYYLRGFNGFTKTVRMYRSTGLMMGFDMSGLLCSLGLVLVMCKEKIDLLQAAVFSLATLFTSRFSILYFAAVTVAYVAINFWNARSIGKRAALLAIGVSAAIFGTVLLIITTASLAPLRSEASHLFPQFYKWGMQIYRAYNINEAFDYTESRHFSIASDTFMAAFGTGVYGGADPGYTRFINCIGFVGLGLVLLWHFSAIRGAVGERTGVFRYRNNKIFITMSLLLVLVGLNFKNSYFFTGTFFEFMMLQLYMFRCCRSYRSEGNSVLDLQEGQQL